MIDTVKLAYPLTKFLYERFTERADLLQKISPNGEMLWEKEIITEQFMKESHYSGLRVSCRKGDDELPIDDKSSLDFDIVQSELQRQKNYKLLSDIKKSKLDCKISKSIRNLNNFGLDKVKPVVFFEFSLQKYQSKSAYNNKNTGLEQDKKALLCWIKELSLIIGYSFNPCSFEFYRVDFAENYILDHGSPVDFIRSFELKLSKYHDAENKVTRYPGGFAYPSGYIGMKMYWKFLEFKQIEMKKHKGIYMLCDANEVDKYLNGFEPLTSSEIKDLMCMVRIEVEFKRDWLRRLKVNNIYNLDEHREIFEEKKQRFLSVQVIDSGNVFFTASEQQLINWVQKYGYTNAYSKFLKDRTSRAWRKTKSNLLVKGVYLDALNNSKERMPEDQVPDQQEYKLTLYK